MRIGAHESVQGGLHLALGRAEADGGRTLQIFTGYNLRWLPREVSDDSSTSPAAIARGAAARARQGRPAVVETPPEADGSPSFARNIATLVGLREDATRAR